MMKFTVSKQELNEAVSNVQRAVSAKSSIPALEGILLECSENKLVLSAYDLSLGMTTTLDAQVEQSGRTVVSARLFSDIVRRMPAETVCVTVDEKNVASIISGVSDFSIICIPGNEFPDFPAVNECDVVNLHSDVLKSMIRQTLYAVAEDDSKPVHKGSLFNIQSGSLDVVSCDGYRLAIRTEPVNFNQDISFVIPGKTLGELLKILKDDDSDVTLYVGSRNIRIETGHYQLVSSLYEGEFLDYHSALPENNATLVTVKTADLVSSVERVSLLISDKIKSPVRCVFENNEVRLSCVTTVGKANDSINAKMQGPAVEIGFNNRYLLDALRNTDCDQVVLKLGGPVTPMIVGPSEGNAFLSLVLPVRIRSEI